MGRLFHLFFTIVQRDGCDKVDVRAAHAQRPFCAAKRDEPWANILRRVVVKSRHIITINILVLREWKINEYVRIFFVVFFQYYDAAARPE